MNKLIRLICIVFVSSILTVSMFGQDKIVVKKMEDLPKLSWKTEKTATYILENESAFNNFITKVKSDIQDILKKYDIRDKTTVKSYINASMAIALIEGDNDKVLKLIEELKALTEKEADKVTTGLVASSLVEAKIKVGKDSPEFAETFKSIYSKKVNALDFELVGDRFKDTKAQYEIRSKNLIMGFLQGQLDPAIEKAGNISFEQALQLLAFKNNFENYLPLKKQIVAVLSDYLEKNKVEKRDIWSAMDVKFSGKENYNDVIIGVWDSGVDTNVFKGSLFVNKEEQVDGKDNDNNGYIDDINGIAFNLQGEYTTKLLYPVPEEYANDVDVLMGLVKGFTDLTSGIDSDEASKVKQKFSQLKPDEVNNLVEGFMVMTLYMHGTHVSGIALAGNPFAKIMVARTEFDYKTIPMMPTVEWAKKVGESWKKTAQYFKQNNVRVVNMSWGESPSEIESMLQANGFGKDAIERKAKAMEIFTILDKALYEAISSTPNVLYITSAGNSDNDVNFDKMIPSSYDLGNIITVGAVDIAGDQTSFTSFGKSVDIYANGFEVESYLPGGERMAASGTSMSSPNVANLAGKIFTVAPELSAEDAFNLIIKGSVKSEDGKFLLINPKKTIFTVAPELSAEDPFNLIIKDSVKSEDGKFLLINPKKTIDTVIKK